jgi:carbon-monoxide dehydrogenase medium subunit
MPIETTICASSLKEALAAKARQGVVAVAGGTDILVRMYDRIDKPWPKLLVLDSVKALDGIRAHDDYIAVGPLVTFSEIEESAIIRKYAPQLVEAASVAGSVQIRNRATIGGNIANASPAGDLIPPLYVLGATLELSSVRKKRTVSTETFFIGPGKTVLRSDELITAIRIPKGKHHGFFLRLGTRKALAISKVSVAGNLAIKRGIISDAKIALGAVAPTVIRAFETEELLRGKHLDKQLIELAAEAAVFEARPIDDIRSDAEYRKAMVGVLLQRGLVIIMESLHAS